MALNLFPENLDVNFMRWRFIAAAISLAVIVLTAIFIPLHGLNLGVDFRGGALIEAQTQGPANLTDIRSKLGALNIGDVGVQEFGAPDLVLIRAEGQDGEDGANIAGAKVQEELRKIAPGVDIRRVETVGGKVSGELIQAGVMALAFALLAMLVYVWFRFDSWHFGLGAMASLLHDVMVTIGFFIVTKIEFNLSTVAALLTIIGYSINDTVVIFDRFREDIRKYKKMPLTELFNLSINVTLPRTIVTSVTTLIAIGGMYAFGGDVIRSFTAAMIVGVIIGTYSTVFIATPLVLWAGYKRPSDRTEPDSAARASA